MVKKTSMIDPHRGEIWQVGFDPQVGHEIRKPRPAVVVSEDHIRPLPLRIVVPIRNWKKDFEDQAWMVGLLPSNLNGLDKKCGADAFQVKSVALERFINRRGKLTRDQTEEIVAAITLCIGYDPTLNI